MITLFRNIIILLFISIIAIYGQNENSNLQIRNAILFGEIIGNPFEGLDIVDTSKSILVVYNYDNNIDTTIIKFDKYGRIDFVETQFQKHHVKYYPDYIYQEVVRYYPPTNISCPSDTTFYEYYFSKKNTFTSLKVNCADGEKSKYNYKYTSLDNMLVVELLNSSNNVLVKKNLFIYNDDKEFFQWEVITSKNIFFKFKKNRFSTISTFDNSTKYNFVEIENISFSDPIRKKVSGQFKDKYSIYDNCGKVIGTIELKRQER